MQGNLNSSWFRRGAIACGICVATLGTASLILAQRAATFDFSSESPKARKHEPKPFPPGTQLAGRCGGVMANPSLRITLESLNAAEYAYGSDAYYVFRLTNADNKPMRIPVVDRVWDVEPEDSAQSFHYEPVEVWLNLAAQEGTTLSVRLITLYGSIEKPTTEVELAPHEWVEIRGKVALLPTDKLTQNFYMGYRTHSDLKPPSDESVEVAASIGYWRGDRVYFDGQTQHEHVGCKNYDMEWNPFLGPIRLLPPTGR